MEAFVAACQAPGVHQQDALRTLLSIHKDTDILQRHGVHVPDEWAAAADGAAAATCNGGADSPLVLLHKLPLTTYSDYEELVEAAVQAGRTYDASDTASQQRWDAAVARLSGLPLYAFKCSSGTTGGQKRMPASMREAQSNVNQFGLFSSHINAAFPGAAAGKELRFPFAGDVEALPSGVQIGVGSSITYRRIVASDKRALWTAG